MRKPPAGNGAGPRAAASIDITPREFAAELQGSAKDRGEGGDDGARPEISVVVGHHLGAPAAGRVREYVRHIARQTGTAGGRVGLIELGDDGLRLTCFDAAQPGEAESEPAEVEPVDGGRISEVLEELSWDVRRWLLFLPAGARSQQARELLAELPKWTVLVTADDEGTISAYRALKGLAAIGKPALSLAVLDGDGAQAEIIHRKLAGASKQFLDRPIELEGLVGGVNGAGGEVAEHVVLWCRATAGTHDHWTAVAALAAKSFAPAAEEDAGAGQNQPAGEPIFEAGAADAHPAAETIPMSIPMPVPAAADTEAQKKERNCPPGVSDVIDLPAGAGGAEILAAALSGETQWVVSPVKPPMCGGAIVAVDREGRLSLLAALTGGLAELPGISRALSWLTENRLLVRMAVPQMNIDAMAAPKLTLFVEAGDAAGGELGAILAGGNVTVRTYQRLRWGGKTGLLLRAA
jgi:hypothetical protein